MNIKKRIIPIVLFFALIASSIAVGQWNVSAAGDTIAPTFYSISVDKSKVYSGENVTISIDAWDASGIDYVYVEYTSPSREVNYSTIIFPEADGKLNEQFPITSEDEAGVWKPEYIAVVDTAGNFIEVYNFQFYASVDARDLSSGNFEVAKLNQSAPTGLVPVQTSAYGASDGKITGTSNFMEYKRSGAAYYTPVTGTEITGLGEGDYYVRYAAKEGYYASPDTQVYVKGPDFAVSNGVLVKYNGPGGDVVIPDNLGITSIGQKAFYQCSNVTSVVIPAGVKSIKGDAFYSCTKMKNVVIPDGITEIEYQAFFNCASLTDVTLPDSVTSIGNNVFDLCTSLTSITLPKGISSISNGMFRLCISLSGITIPDSVTTIGNSAFDGCGSFTSINLPSGVTSIGENAFSGCRGLTSIELPTGVTKISKNMFSSCSGLKNVVIPSGVTSIGNYAFSYCSGLTSIELPSGLTSIGENAFFECNGLTSLTLPTGITSISHSMMSSCRSLTSITLPDGLKSISGYAFYNCVSLTNIALPSGVTSIGDSAFEYCNKLTSIEIPSGVTTISTYAFSKCSALTSITSYPLVAPKTEGSAFNGIPSNAIVKILPGAAGYDVSPWAGYSHSTVEPNSIEISVLPKKTVYIVGQSINLTGLVVAGTFEGGMKAPVAVTDANISGFDSSTSVEGQAVTVTAGGKTATFKVDIIAQPTETVKSGNMAAGKLFTSPVFTNLPLITDGNKATSSFAEDNPSSGLQYVQVDLGDAYDINDFKLWHYYGDVRKYKDVIVQISNDPTFTTGVKTIFNNDANNSAKLGIGTDIEYSETSAGLDIEFDAVSGRYMRFYSNGSDKNSNNHYVEIEIYGMVPVIHPDSLSLSKATAAVETGSTYSLAATVLPAETTNKSVTWSSSDTSVATVSAAGVVTGVRAGTAKITAMTVDGQIAKSCDFTVIAAAKNLSNGKQFTSPVFNNISCITDGNKSTASLADDYPAGGGLQYVQMDLGAYYDLTKINLWHYYIDGRKYKDVAVQVSNDPTFATDVTTVYNNDSNNSSGLGIGLDAEYAETSVGKSIQFDKVNARYVRLYSNGSDKNTNNHYVEAEVYGFDGPVVHPSTLSLNKETAALEVGGTSTLTAKIMPLNTTDKSVTWSSSEITVATVSSTGAVTGVKAGTAVITATSVDGEIKGSCTVTVTAVPKNLTTGKLFSSTVFNNIASITDGNKSLSSLADDYPAGSGLQYVQMDLGAYYDLSKINLWHYYGDGRKYKDVIVQVSNDPTFATDVTTVYNNDTNNSAGLGAGTEVEYAETSAEKTIMIDMVNARYVRLYSNGSDKNTSNHYIEAEVYGFYGPVVNSAALTLNKATAALAVGGTSTLTAKVMPLNTTDKSVTWASSAAGVATVSSSGTVTGIAAGKATITATTADGKLAATCEVTVTVAPSNLSAGKQFTSSVFKDIARVTDGSKSTGSFSEDYPNGGGLQYMQLDLGEYYDLSNIKLWHYYGDGRKYKDVIVQVSNDPTFATDVTTVYSNDTDNSAKLGTGTKAEYAETSAGLDVQFDTVNARYVRLYSNGSNLNRSNHYVEVEVYGMKGASVHPSSMSLSKSTMKIVEGAAESLAASVLPLNTTDKSVTWKSSDESVATVSSSGLVTGVKAGTAIITATTVDGSIEGTCTVTVSPAPLSAGKQFTSSVFTGLSKITDGSKSTGSFAEDYPNGGGLQYVQMDLYGYYDLSGIKLWHYYGDGRKYKDVIVQVSNDPTFSTDVTTVYSNDTNNSAGFGIGTSAEYAETSAGLDIPFETVNARYVRFYSNGSDKNSNNHYVEIEIYGAKGAVIHPESISLNKTAETIMVDERFALTATVMPLNTTNKNVTWSSSDVSVARVSDSGMVSGIKAGTATITATTVEGSTATCKFTVEPTPINLNLTAGKVFTSPVFKDLGRITDGNRSTGSFSEDYPLGGGLQYVQIDLGENYYLTDIRLWHYYGDGRKYKDVIVQVSNDPTFTTGVKTVYNNDTNNSAGRGAGTNTEYAETSSGLDMYAAVSGRYVRFYSNGSTVNSNNHYAEIEIIGFKANMSENQAAGKSLTSSVDFAGLSKVTDGSKSTGSFSEDYPAGGGLQWVQVDMGISYEISDIKLWHYFGDSRTYHDVVVQVSDDPTFKTGVTTVYNNDIDGSAKLGIGTKAEYTETSSGLDIPATSVNGRYVRFYSSGSTANSNNHYVELEVYGK